MSICELSYIGRIYTRDELSGAEFILEDDLPISEDSVPGQITRLGINPVFRRIMWLNLSSADSSVSTSWRRVDRRVEFSHIIRLNTGFIPRRGIRLRQTNYPSQTHNSSQTDNSSLI